MYLGAIRRLERMKGKEREREILSDYWTNRKVVVGSSISPLEYALRCIYCIAPSRYTHDD